MRYTKNEVNAIARTAYEQLVASVPGDVYGSWGVSQIGMGVYEDMASLILHVNGFLHKGPVFISYNSGFDLYEVVLVQVVDRDVIEIKRVKEVYFDQLGDVVDRLVERGDCTRDEYEEKVRQSLKS